MHYKFIVGKCILYSINLFSDYIFSFSLSRLTFSISSINIICYLFIIYFVLVILNFSLFFQRYVRQNVHLPTTDQHSSCEADYIKTEFGCCNSLFQVVLNMLNELNNPLYL